MSTELKDKLEQAKARKLDQDQSVQFHANLSEELQEEIAALEKQIAAEAKPKLSRDGDYSFRENSDYIHVKFGKDIFNNFGGKNPFGYDPTMDIMQGNILDDLKALQETVTEFEMNMVYTNDVKAYWSSDRLCFKQGNDYFYIPQKKLPAFILKLRQMEATHKRDK